MRKYCCEYLGTLRVFLTYLLGTAPGRLWVSAGRAFISSFTDSQTGGIRKQEERRNDQTET